MRLNAISEPTYAVLSVTGQTKAAGDTPEWSAEGKGMAFGSVVHRTIEMLGKGLPESKLEDTIRFLADEEGMAEELISEAARVVRSVIASELWQRSLRARRRL